jgi:hypothetical protein
VIPTGVARPAHHDSSQIQSPVEHALEWRATARASAASTSTSFSTIPRVEASATVGAAGLVAWREEPPRLAAGVVVGALLLRQGQHASCERDGGISEEDAAVVQGSAANCVTTA